MAIFDLKNTVIKIKGGGVGEEVEITVGDGNVSWDETRELNYLKDRGNLDGVTESEENPIDVSLDMRWTFFKVTGEVTPYEALTAQGDAASWTSTDAVDPCGPLAVDIEIDFTPYCSDEDREIYTLKAFRYTSISPSGSDQQLSCSGSCNTRHVDVTRAAQP